MRLLICTIALLLTGVLNGCDQIANRPGFPCDLLGSLCCEEPDPGPEPAPGEEPPREGLPAVLMAHYPFNGDATDATPNGNNGEVNGPVLAEDRFNVPNSAYLFDGIDDYIVCERPMGITGSSPRTVMAWINVLSLTDDTAVIHWGTETTAGFNDLWVSERYPNPAIFRFRGHWHDIDSGTANAIRIGQWQFIAFTYDGETGRLYVDGELDTQAALDLRTTDTAVSFGINLDHAIDVPLNRFYHGSLDDVRIYDRALSAEEIGAVYQEGGWDPAFDPGDPDSGEVPDILFSPVSVLRLDGAGDWVRIPVLDLDNPLAYPGSGGWSLEALTKPASSQRVAVLCGQASTNASPMDPYYLEIGDGTRSGTGGGSFKVQDNAGNVTWTGDTPAFAEVGQWIHVAGTFEDGSSQNTIRFYVNGEQQRQAQTAVTIGSRASPDDPFAIGALASWGGESGFVPFEGDIGEVRVWSRTLSAEEIRTNMGIELTGTEPGLVGYWNFSELTPDGLVPDVTGNGNDGHLLFDAHLAQTSDPP